jgi:hypothetical protein
LDGAEGKRLPSVRGFSGDKATRGLGQLIVDNQVVRAVKALTAVKADARSLELQNEFFDRVDAQAAGKGDTRR